MYINYQLIRMSWDYIFTCIIQFWVIVDLFHLFSFLFSWLLPVLLIIVVLFVRFVVAIIKFEVYLKYSCFFIVFTACITWCMSVPVVLSYNFLNILFIVQCMFPFYYITYLTFVLYLKHVLYIYQSCFEEFFGIICKALNDPFLMFRLFSGNYIY